MKAWWLLVLVGCGLEEREDFLVGRQCPPPPSNSCDPGQSCLPHRWTSQPDDFRCRDRSSFLPIGDREAPLAYCDDQLYRCPGDLVCNADRVRVDASVRLRVCRRPDDIFAPPLDGGGS